MTTLRNEQILTINGVEGRAFNVIQWPAGDARHSGKIANQKWISESRDCSDEHGKDAKIKCEIRFDDNCKNGHESFAITGEIRVRNHDYMSGCIHDEIAKYFPELEPLIKWHLTSTDGPMHYVENTIYAASDKDLNGYRKGEPCSFEELVFVGNSPIPQKMDSDLRKFVKNNLELNEYNLKHVLHAEKPELYGSKVTLEGLDHTWYQCPFDSEVEAKGWCEALILKMVHFEKHPTAISQGKERDLAAARSHAVWPEATDVILCADKEILTAALNERLPALMDVFEKTIRDIGFMWSAEQ